MRCGPADKKQVQHRHETMGASVSVIAPTFELMSPRMWADPEVRRLWQSCEERHSLIAQKEREFLLAQRDVMFRKHDEIIRILMCKTKKQLKRVVNGKVPGSCMTVDEVESLGGGPYAKFIGACCMDETACRVRELDLAIGGVGCNEDLLVMALCCCDTKDLKAVQQYKGKPLADVIKGKTKPGSPLQKFLLAILQLDRKDEVGGGGVNVEAAAAQAQEIHSNGAGRSFGVVEEPIFAILAQASRAQCQAIDAAYMQLNNTSLIAALSTKFSGALRLGLTLWVQASKADATAVLLNNLVAGNASCDSNVVARILARNDKPALTLIDDSCKSLFKAGSLFEMLGTKAVTGNFAKAVLAWISAPTMDDGHETDVGAFIEEQMVWQGDKDLQTFLFEMAGTQKVCDELKVKLAAEDAALATYLDKYHHADYVIAKAAAQKGEQQRASSKVQREASALKGMAPPSSKRGSILAKSGPSINKSRRGGVIMETSGNDVTTSSDLAAAAEAGAVTHEDFQVELGLISTFLNARFHEFDTNNSGSLPSDVFWQFFDGLPLIQLGFTVDEAEAMKSWVDWEHDGYVNFEEIHEELADSIVESLGGVGKGVRATIAELMKSLPASAQAFGGDDAGRLAPDLVDYLQTTFEAYDLQKTGMLDYEEFWQLVQAMNLGVTAADYEQIQAQWDGNKDGQISWSEAIVQLDKLLGDMIVDGQDHWIGLVDKESGALFWYNIADGVSQWMDEDDQNNFRAHTSEEVLAAEAAAAEALAAAQAKPKNPMAIKRRSVYTKSKTGRVAAI